MTMAKDAGVSDESYINKKKAREVVSKLQTYVNCIKNESLEQSGKQQLPSMELSKVILEIDLKKVPLNNSTFINVIGPLPKPFNFETDTIDICLMVKDPNPKKPLKDRELDLENTREIYQDLLIEAGFSDDFLNQRLNILPMRELLTEYREFEAKSKLSKSYDVFLVDKRLVANKFSGLKRFLGTHFWNVHKKMPFPVDLSRRGQELKEDIVGALSSTALYVTGKGSTSSVAIGLVNQPPGDLTNNLIHVLKQVKLIFGKNVSVLKLYANDSNGNCDPIPFFVDMESPNELDDSEIAPRTKLSDKVKPATGQVSLFDDVFVTVTGPGKFTIAETRKRKAIDDGNSDDEPEGDGENAVDKKKPDKMVERVKNQWIEKTSKKKLSKNFKPSENVATGKPKRKVRQLIESKTG